MWPTIKNKIIQIRLLRSLAYRQTLSTWLKKADDMKTRFLSGKIKPNRKNARGSKFPEVESAVQNWFKAKRSSNIPIAGEMVRERARNSAPRNGSCLLAGLTF